MEEKKICSINSLENHKMTKSYTAKERMDYLKKLSGELSDEIVEKAEILFPNEVDIVLELLKIELNYRFNSNLESSL